MSLPSFSSSPRLESNVSAVSTTPPSSFVHQAEYVAVPQLEQEQEVLERQIREMQREAKIQQQQLRQTNAPLALSAQKQLVQHEAEVATEAAETAAEAAETAAEAAETAAEEVESAVEAAESAAETASSVTKTASAVAETAASIVETAESAEAALSPNPKRKRTKSQQLEARREKQAEEALEAEEALKAEAQVSAATLAAGLAATGTLALASVSTEQFGAPLNVDLLQTERHLFHILILLGEQEVANCVLGVHANAAQIQATVHQLVQMMDQMIRNIETWRAPLTYDPMGISQAAFDIDKHMQKLYQKMEIYAQKFHQCVLQAMQDLCRSCLNQAQCPNLSSPQILVYLESERQKLMKTAQKLNINIAGYLEDPYFFTNLQTTANRHEDFNTRIALFTFCDRLQQFKTQEAVAQFVQKSFSQLSRTALHILCDCGSKLLRKQLGFENRLNNSLQFYAPTLSQNDLLYISLQHAAYIQQLLGAWKQLIRAS